ncbi:MAG: undecaprenyldiphospho-muramoylpentapeptide beta-N-acetylglucosaminyltransferase [Saprospiraceae bacterium]|nr:undecaprenyldiphospho-muramoylpentapeptide beta-N-acetylglucosaminyltransferase [Saprospiraceae bacterium]
MSSGKTYKVILSGGGTGGHIYPAIAIANGLKRQLGDVAILFVGAKGKMEMEKVPKAGYEIIGLDIAGFQRKLTFSNLLLPFKLVGSFLKARKIIKDFRPDLVVGTGGYASGPVLLAAQGMGIPTAIQEQNAFPGITNKKLGKKAARIFTAYEGLDKYFPADAIFVSGNPVRKEIAEELPKREEAIRSFGLDPSKPTLLNIGGSLGSRTLNNVWKANAEALTQQGYQLIWQTGKTDFATIQSEVNAPAGVMITEFIHDMPTAYAAADVIVSRAGAIAISELCLVGKPVVLVPYPFAAEDHQTKNALALVEQQAALHVKDADAPIELANASLELLGNATKRSQMGVNILKLGKPDATQTIVQELKQLIQA